MKNKFNAIGVANAATVLLAQSTADRVIQLRKMTADFIEWMDQHFDLQPHQMRQLQNLPPSFREELARAIANSLIAGQAIQFLKEAKSLIDDPDFKELSVRGLEEWQKPFVEGMQRQPLVIQIAYRQMQLA